MMRIGGTCLKFAAMLRMLPALAWLAVQLSMVGLPIQTAGAAQHPDSTIAALFKALGEERIVLCTPEGKQVLEHPEEHAVHAECEWCQGFSATIRPDGPTVTGHIRQTATPAWNRLTEHRTTFLRAQVCHPCRAPPAPI